MMRERRSGNFTVVGMLGDDEKAYEIMAQDPITQVGYGLERGPTQPTADEWFGN